MRGPALLAVLLCAGCLSQLVPEHKSSTQTKPTVDLAEPDPAPQEPMDDLAEAPSGDMDTTAMPDGGSLLAFGAPCTVPADCASNHCEQIMMMLLCTVPCTMKGLADPACPNTGMCNNNGFCKP